MATEGLRERNKRRTRMNIQRAALRLFAERGFQATTIAAIAEAAEVAPRTVSLYFPAKDDLLFAPDVTLTELAARFQTRDPGQSALGALRGWIAESLEAQAADPGSREDRRLARTRREIIDADPALRQRERGHMERLEECLAAAIAADTGEPPDALTPTMAAASVAAAFAVLRRSALEEGPTAFDVADVLSLVDRIIGFAEAGIAASAGRT